MKKKLYLSILLCTLLIITLSVNTAAFSAEHANFSVEYNGLKIPFKIFSIFVMPREEIKFSIAEEDKGQMYQIELGGKIFESDNSFNWNAHAESGYYQATIKEKNNNGPASEIKINVFVLHPRGQKNGQYLENFRIGNYPEIPTDKKDHYKKPDGFWKIDESILDLKITPHFKVAQFLTRQSNQLPQFIAIQESLLLKLEFFLEEVNKAGYQAETFGIVSLYRSPYFNKKIGNDTDFSRHLFGDAADIYIDNSGDRWMDDLNGDSQSTKADADLLYDLAVKFDQKEEFFHLQGGVCSYKGNGVRGPFIHIDTRGFHVSW
ncbi:peptidase M15-like protein [Halanaerobium saccharolyticum]|uniref:Peptidase M15-like protein n=1 Tax=Halanaerobium saccharolyticum TaxID=43595 RepID=A0A4R6LHJ0_9FIRM|nr:peptidase M15A [Halanaerobium saccharolyticum]TDO78278.1 peptidase M15-like protein [Halanaerobium saccharolyticum]